MRTIALYSLNKQGETGRLTVRRFWYNLNPVYTWAGEEYSCIVDIRVPVSSAREDWLITERVGEGQAVLDSFVV